MAKSRRRRSRGSSKLKRVLRLAAKLRKRGKSAKAALRKAWASIKRTKRTHSTKKSHITRHRRKRRLSAIRRITMAKHRRKRSRVRHRRHARHNPMGSRVRHRRHRRSHRRHGRRASRSIFSNPLGGKLFAGVGVKEVMYGGVGAIGTVVISQRWVTPVVAKFAGQWLGVTGSVLAGNLITTAGLSMLAGAVLGREAAKSVAAGGLVATVIDVGLPLVSGMMNPGPVLPPPAQAGGMGVGETGRVGMYTPLDSPAVGFYTPPVQTVGDIADAFNE